MAQLDIPGKLREYIREEQHGIFTLSLGEIVSIDNTAQRATVTLIHDSDVELDNVPIAMPFASGDGGDILPIDTGDRGFVLFNREPLDVLLQQDRETYSSSTDGENDADPEALQREYENRKAQEQRNINLPNRRHSIQDAVFFPAMPYFNTDDIPEHSPGDRVISHPSGTLVRFSNDGSIGMEHPTGVSLEFTSRDEPDTNPEMSEYEDGMQKDDMQAYAEDSRWPIEPDLIETEATIPDERDGATGAPELLLDEEQRFPPTDSGYGKIEHPTGLTFYVTESGIHVAPGEVDITDPSQLGELKARVEQNGISVGLPTDPMRIELENHRHKIPNEDGSFMLTGPPIPHRELFEIYLADAYDGMQNSDSDHHQRAKQEIANYHAWLESKTGQTLNPSPDKDDNGDIIPPGDEADSSNWPHPEHVPDIETRLNFDPNTDLDQ